MKHKITIYAAMALTFVMTLFPSCGNAVFEDLAPCEQKVEVRFIYDYNMEFANAFTTQVDCITLLAYDENANHVGTFEATQTETSNENWRMQLDLPPGTYHLIAYGGLNCEDASFHFDVPPSKKTRAELKVNLREPLLSAPKGHPLHHLFYGDAEVTVPEPGTTNSTTEVTVKMMKDTNDFRVLLAYEDGRPIEETEFEFTITDDNTSFNWDNSLISQGTVTYYPWTRSTTSPGVTEEEEPSMLAYAEISTSRLTPHTESRLEVKRVSDGKRVVSIPLSEMLLLLKSDRFNWMGSQEFLDRQSIWNLTFILTGDDYWAGTSVIINNWVVRINNIEGK